MKLENQLSRNSLFEIYFSSKTQHKNSKGTTGLRDCTQKPSILQSTRTLPLRSAVAFPHLCGTLSISIRNWKAVLHSCQVRTKFMLQVIAFARENKLSKNGVWGRRKSLRILTINIPSISLQDKKVLCFSQLSN